MTDTLPCILRPLMDGDSLLLDHCAVCGRTWPLNRHHVVRRGAGKLFRDGVEVPKPVITLCGSGNNLMGPDGPWCHGLAHANRLHFRWVGRWEYIVLAEPTKYQAALGMDGWEPIREI